MTHLAERYLAARRKGWLRSRLVVTDRKVPTPGQLAELEGQIGCALPQEMQEWLAIVGFCTIDDDLNFQPVWFRRVEEGHLRGAVIFGQDTLGNFYGFVPIDHRVVLFFRSEPSYAVLAGGFKEFLAKVEAHDFKVLELSDAQVRMPYEWAAV
jgi:hypothetical protein